MNQWLKLKVFKKGRSLKHTQQIIKEKMLECMQNSNQSIFLPGPQFFQITLVQLPHQTFLQHRGSENFFLVFFLPSDSPFILSIEFQYITKLQGYNIYKYQHKPHFMNLIAQQFAKINTTQIFITKFLQHISEYFKKSTSLTQQKTYNILRSITQRLHEYFPEDDFLVNICSKAIAIVKMKIDDKFIDQHLHQNQNQQRTEKIDQMMKQFSRKSSMESKSEARRSINADWLKKLVTDQLSSLKSDLTQNEQLVQDELCKIFKTLSPGPHPLNCLLFDSALDNGQLLSKCVKNQGINIKISTIILDGVNGIKNSDVDLKAISYKIRDFDAVFISGDSILKNGNILAPSGTLMVVLAAKMHRKPIYVISRGFCLTEKIIFDHKTLNNVDNPLKYFKGGQHKINKLYVAKKFDLIQSSDIQLIISQFDPCEPENIQIIFQEYYQKL